MKKYDPEAHDKITERYGSNFCAAPWTSYYETANGKVVTCCKSSNELGNSKEQSISEIMNSDKLKVIRQQFLANERPAQCTNCWKVEDQSGKVSNNRSALNMYSLEHIDQAIAHTLPDGTITKQFPTWLDLTWSNKCNFACLGCSPDFSDTIARKYLTEFDLLHDTNRQDNPHFSIIHQSSDSQDKIKYIIEHQDTIQEIHISGGEPFLNEGVYELLEEMLRHRLNEKIELLCHTNGSITHSYKGVDIVSEYFAHWGDRVRITLSHDGHGQRGQYIRYGYNEEKWLKNFQRFVDAGLTVGIQSCWNAFNAVSLEEHAEWYMDNCMLPEGLTRGSLTLWSNIPLSGDTLKNHEPTAQAALTAIERLIESGRHPNHWDTGLEKYRAILKNPNISPHSIPSAFLQGTEALDAKRPLLFDEVFPELVDFRNHLRTI